MNLRRKFTGAKHHTEAMDNCRIMVGERSKCGEALPEGDVERLEERMPV